MKLSEKIYYLRKKDHMTQEDLAQICQVSRQAVSKWELGESKPDIDSIEALANVFDISVDELLNRKTKQKNRFF